MTENHKCINSALHEMVVDGIKYEHIEGHYYEMGYSRERNRRIYGSSL